MTTLSNRLILMSLRRGSRARYCAAKNFRRTLFWISLFALLPQISAAENITPDHYEKALQAKAQGEYAQAQHLLQQLLLQRDDDWRFWFQLGQVQRFQSRWAEAIAAQERALSLAPNNQDVRLELARVHIATGNPALAKDLIEQILRAQPDYQEALTLKYRLEQPPSITAAPSQLQHWQMIVGAERSTFSGDTRAPWLQTFTQLGARFHNGTAAYLHFSNTERFDITNQHTELGVSHRFGKYSAGYGSIGYTDNALFIPKWRIKLGGDWRFPAGHQGVGLSGVSFDAQYDQYTSTSTAVFKPGVRFHLLADVDLHLQAIAVLDENDDLLNGASARIHWTVQTIDSRFFIGAADAPETENGVTVSTRSWSAGAVHWLTEDIELHGAYTTEDRGTVYVRQVFTLALSIKW